MSQNGNSAVLVDLRKSARASSVDRLWDAAIFIGFLVFSGLAIAAVAVATPLVLAVSALAGLFSKKADGAAWRSAHA